VAEQNDKRRAALNLTSEEFRGAGHELIDRVADFLEQLPQQPVTRGESPGQIRALLPDDELPERGESAESLLRDVAPLLFRHSLHNGHPRFLGYITSSAAPLGMLADFLASAVNANVGKWDLSPVASEIEAQTVRWIAQLIGYPADCGGLLVSGGNMANYLGFMAARCAQVDWDIRSEGLHTGQRRLTVYASRETHTWIEKATDLSGLGTDAIRWIDTDTQQRLQTDALREAIAADRAAGASPFLIVGTAGNVSTGAVDPLVEIADICRAEKLWFHVDGAYGAPAAALEDAGGDLKALALADSVALDPHKWLYSPLEAGCTLVRNADALRDAFSYMPAYYELGATAEEPGNNYYALGFQNSRGFRALKVWLSLRQAGRSGLAQMIRDDIELAAYLHQCAAAREALQPFSLHLSIVTLRYCPPDLDAADEAVEEYLNRLNQQLLDRVQRGGEAFISNAVIDGRYLLRACVVNFRTRQSDMDFVADLLVRTGDELDAQLRPDALR
jgi:glutamate/tyrosine decarboxylase-like PLP-dependent enzyme